MNAHWARRAVPDKPVIPAEPLDAERTGASFSSTRLQATATRFRASLTGLSPETIALIFAIGLVLGVFPVYGVPTVLCAAVAVAFRLNLPAIQLVNQVCSPLQLALAVPLGRAGERILRFGLNPGHSPVLKPGMTLWSGAGAARNAVVGWCALCVPLGLVFYVILTFVLHRRRGGKT